MRQEREDSLEVLTGTLVQGSSSHVPRKDRLHTKHPQLWPKTAYLKTKKKKKNYKNRDLFYFLLEFIVTGSFYNKALKTSYFIEYLFVFDFESIFKMGITNSVF